MTRHKYWRPRSCFLVGMVLLGLGTWSGEVRADPVDEARQALEACRFQEAKAKIEALSASDSRRDLAERFRDAVRRETTTQELFRAAETKLAESDFEGALESLMRAKENTACERYAATIETAAGKVRTRWSEAALAELGGAVRACDFSEAARQIDRMAAARLPGVEQARTDLAAAYAHEKITSEKWESARAVRRKGEAENALQLLLDAGFHTRCPAYGRRIIEGAAQIASDVEAKREGADWPAVAKAWAGPWQGAVSIAHLRLGDLDGSVKGLRAHMAKAVDDYRLSIEADVAPEFGIGSTPSFGSFVALYRLALATAGADLFDALFAAADAGIPVALTATPAPDGLRLAVPDSPLGRNDAELLLRPLTALPTLRPLGQDSLYGIASSDVGVSILVRLRRDGEARFEAALAVPEGQSERQDEISAALGLGGIWLVVSSDLESGAPDWPTLKARLAAIGPAKAGASEQ